MSSDSSSEMEMDDISPTKEHDYSKAKGYTLVIMLTLVMFVLIVVAILVVSFIVYYFSKKEIVGENVVIPEGMRKMYFNHLMYKSPGSRYVVEGESSVIYVNLEEELSIFHIENEEDKYFVSENDLKLNCEVTCSCYEDSSRRLNTVQKVRLISVGIIFACGALILFTGLTEQCDEQCSKEGMKSDGVDDYVCEEHDSGLY